MLRKLHDVLSIEEKQSLRDLILSLHCNCHCELEADLVSLRAAPLQFLDGTAFSEAQGSQSRET